MDKSRQQKNNKQKELQDDLAEQSGLAIVLVDESVPVSISNNNSICEILFSSAEFSSQCAEFCGKAFNEGVGKSETVSVRCYAGIHYQIVPLKTKQNKQFVSIVGRSFLKSEDYRNATKRAIEGDWQNFQSDKLFQNILLSSSEFEITKLSKRLQKLSEEEKETLLQIESDIKKVEEDISKPHTEELSNLIKDFQNKQINVGIKGSKPSGNQLQNKEEISAWRSLFSSLLEKEYRECLVAIASFLQKRYQISTLAWLENRRDVLESIWSTGNLLGQQIQISISATDLRFLEVVQKETSLKLREQRTNEQNSQTENHIHLFPVAIGGKVKSALVIGDDLQDEDLKRKISRFIKNIAPEFEILRLREEVKQQSAVTKAVQKFNQALSQIDSEDFWLVLAQKSAELMRAERGSILIYDDNSERFIVKAAIGNRADVIKMLESDKIGERVSQNVLKSGRPLVVKDAKKSGFVLSPPEWRYKTNSFISYPIIISGRKIGVLNLTDKVGGGSYDETDLELLHTLAPQIALALDRTSLIRKAGEFQQLSITDPLTGLVNRRYLEERITEELNRSQRHGYPVSFMMIDVDSFKSYNDSFGHTEGDKALQIVGQCLKSVLRGADVAARYGGEEFSILLPQTTLKEAIIIAERVRQKVESTRFPSRQVTISIGLAVGSSDIKTAKEFIEIADKALYEAKESGRNRVQVYKKKEDTASNAG